MLLYARFCMECSNDLMRSNYGLEASFSHLENHLSMLPFERCWALANKACLALFSFVGDWTRGSSSPRSVRLDYHGVF